MKKFFMIATTAFVLASCSTNDFVGDQELKELNEHDPISLTGGASVITRTTQNSGSVVDMLDGQFKVYGVKSGSTAGSDLQKVFVNYSVWNATANTTTSNDRGWEYVGASTATNLGQGNISLSQNQTIKYWDHSAADYRFVAGSPISAFTYTVNNNNAIESASVTGLAGHIVANPVSGSGTAMTTNPVYIAKPLIITETNYRKPVTFEFVRQQSRVRVGVYETIPGYKITQIKFYTYTAGSSGGSGSWSSSATSTENIILASATADYFVGGSNASATVTYNWSGSESGVTYPNYTFTYQESGLTTANNWYGGLLTGVKATTSNHTTISEFYGTDNDMESTSGYFTVIPTPSGTAAAPLLIKCDYTLTSLGTDEGGDGSGETINVTGATAAVPAAFSKWAPNTSYTYLFKISDNTNGKTNPNKDAVGLFPITFDAVVMTEVSGTEQGTVTTVSTPSITTYQAGSVTTTGIEYVKNKPIYLTVANNETGALNTLINGGANVVKVFSLGTEAKTEAEMQLQDFSNATDMFTPGTSAKTIQVTISDKAYDTVTLPANQHGSFTPTADGYYAIQYLTTAANGSTPAAYTYKVVYVGTINSSSNSGSGN